MKFIVEISGTSVLLDANQMQILSTALTGAERLTNIDVGRDNGTHGYANQYVYGVGSYNQPDLLSVKILPAEDYEARKFITKQHEGKKE